MKGKLFVGLAILAVLASTVCIMASCSEKETDVPPREDIEEVTEMRTVEIICGENRTLKSYELGTEIKLKADILADETFVCWLAEGEPFSYEKEVIYKVTRDAVVRAVYASSGSVTLNTDGGELPENYEIKVSAYGGIITNTNGALFKEYGYVLPVPEKRRFGFVGWSAGGTLVTDEKGVSKGVYKGEETIFKAVYKENPFVNIVLKNGESGETTEELKAYIEDGAVRITAPVIIDRQCIGWKLEEQDFTGEEEFIFVLTDEKVVSGETYVFEAQYREAYELTVISGSGGGFYSRTDKISIKGTIPVGSNFVEWRIKHEGKQYVLGRTADGLLCFINGENVIYFSEEENSVVTVPKESVGAEKSPITEEFTLEEIEKIGVVISGGAKTLLKAESERKEHTVFYSIDCNVNGKYCLDSEGEISLIEAGFEKSKTEEGVFLKEEYYDYNNAIILATVPTILHYKFGNWENRDNSGKIPSYMPDRDIYAVGTFVPETHKISVKSEENGKGTAKIGASGTLSGYYEYGQTIEIYVVAESGYKFGQWLDKENKDASQRIVQQGDPVKTDTIYYVYQYTVEKEESFTVCFVERDYTITYILSVVYDGRDVTDDANFFEEGEYIKGYNITTESRNYGERGGLKDKVKIKGESTPGGIALIYGASNWTVSDWKADREGLGDLNDFAMPRYDVTVRSVCEIKSYSIGFSAQEGVRGYSVSAINGKSPSLYESGTGTMYLVPFGSVIDVEVNVFDGYKMKNVKVGGEILGQESGYEQTTPVNYTSTISFVLTKSEKSNIYVIYAERNIHAVKYYVSADYLHTDEDRLLSAYIDVDETERKTVGNIDYYLVTGILTDGEMKDVTKADMIYGQQIEDPTIDATNFRYSFAGWTRMMEDVPYNENVMPDGSVWSYGRLSLQSYNVSVARNIFKFDDASESVSTANVNKIVENEEEEIYGENNPFVNNSGHLYYSEITLKRHSPTGYNFNLWKITSTTAGQSDAFVSFDVSETEEGVINKVEAGNRIFKYRVNNDETITVFLTDNIEIEAEFRVMTFTATSIDERTQIKDSTAGSNKFSTVYTFEYGSTLDFLCNYTTITRNGNKITGFTVSENENMSAVTETLGSGFDEESLTYPTSTAIIKTTEERYYCDIFVKAEIEAINYRVYYNIYSVADSLNHLTGEPVILHENAIEQKEYTVNYNGTISLIGEDETKAVADNAGLDVNNSMHSGWYSGNTLDYTKSEGVGFRNATGAYSTERTYKHETYSSHAYFSCYLVRIITSHDGEAELNDTIKNTTEYKNYVGEHYRQIEIPATGTDGKNITALAEEAFIGFSTITSVSMPATVKKIGARAFKECSSLTETGAVAAIEEIGQEAYYGCLGITEITIGESVYKIGNSAFAEMRNLATINYLSVATLSGLNKIEVGSQVFGNSGENVAEGIALIVGTGVSVIIKDLFCSRESIGGYPANGRYLTSVSFAEGANARQVAISGGAFAGSGIKTFNATNRVAEIGESAFGYCDGLKEADLSQASVTNIGKKAFEFSGLNKVIIPEGVTEIRGYAFSGCDALTSVYYSSNNGLSIIGERAFSRGEGRDPQKLVRITHVSEMEKENGGEQVIRLENLAQMGMEAFYHCGSIKEVVIGGEATILGASAFVGAKSLAKLTYNVVNGAKKDSSDSATFVQTQSTNCELIIGNAVNNIPDYAFYGFSAVKTLTVPETISGIGVQSFGMMSGLTLINFNPDGEEYQCEETATPFFGAGAEEGMRVVFGTNVKDIRAGVFGGATKLTAIEIAESQTLSLTIGNKAFAGTTVSTVTLPLRNGITVGEKAFEGVPLTALSVAENNKNLVLKAGAFGSSANPEQMTVNMMGRVLSSLSATVGQGEFAITQTTKGLKGTLVGTMSTYENIDFKVEKTDEFELNGTDTVFTIKTGATVHGKLLSVNGATIYKAETARYFKAVAYDKSDFIEKNAFGEYTHLKITEGEGIVFESSLTVNAVEFEVATGVEFLATTTIFVNSLIVADGAKVKVNATKFSLSGGDINGELTAMPGAEIVIGDERLINDGNAPDDGYGKGIKVVSGETVVARIATGFAYNVTSGEAEINYDYQQIAGYNMKVSGGALTISADAVFSHYEAAEGTELAVTETGFIELSGYTTGQDGALWTVDAAVSSLQSDAKKYYGTLAIAYNKADEEDATYLLGKNLEITEDTTAPYIATILDFNGFGITLSNCGIIGNEKITLINANLTATGESVAITSDGEIVVESGSINAESGAIVVIGISNVTIKAEAQVTSSSGTAITTTSDMTVNGTVTGFDFGIKVIGNNANIAISGEIEATGTNGTAVYTQGGDVAITAESGATLRGDMGIKSVRSKQTTTNTAKPLINLKSGATVVGQTVGILTIGAGYSKIDGTVSATSERGVIVVGEERIYKGAVVAVENTKGEATYARMSIGGEVTNANGDAVLYVGYDKADSSSAGYAAITLETTATVNGIVTEYVAAYEKSLNGSEEGREIYASNENEEMTLYYGATEAGTDEQYYYIGSTRIQTGRAFTSDEPANNGDGKTARYLSHYVNIADAFGKKGIIRVGSVTVPELPADETIVISGTAEIENATRALINGKVGVAIGGKLIVNSNAEIGGRLIFFDYSEEENYYCMEINSGADVTVSGSLTTKETAKIKNGGRFEVTGDREIKGKISGTGESTTAFFGNVTIGSLEINGGQFETATGDTLTVRDMTVFGGDYEITSEIIVENLTLDSGVNIIANGRFVVSGSLTASEDLILTLNADGNEIESSTIGFTLNVSGKTTIKNSKDYNDDDGKFIQELRVRGMVIINAQLTFNYLHIETEEYRAGKASVETRGKMVLNRGGILDVTEFRIGTGGGVENKGGKITAMDRWCSELYERYISGHNGTRVNVIYDDCNPFGMIAGDFGEITSLSKHTLQQASTSTITAFKTLSELFATFMGNFEIPTDGSAYIPTVSGDALDSYTEFYNKAIEIYSESFVSFARDMSNELTKSAVIGANHPYTMAFGTDVSPELIDFQEVIARLFGFSSKTEFMGYAQNLADTYAQHRSNIENSLTTNKALDNGCFYTDNGSFVFPIAVKNELASKVLAYVILDTAGLVSVWVNDITAALWATNFNSSYHTDSIINNELYCKNILFVISSNISISSGGWMFTEEGSTAFDYIHSSLVEEISVDVFDGEVLKGKVVSRCSGEKLVTVAPTCGEVGYTGCIYEVNDTLSDGTPIVIKHDRHSILPATGEHTFEPDDGSGKHRCTVCGLYEEHVSEYVAAAYMDETFFDGDNQMFILGEVCSVCNDRHTLVIIDCEMTEREFNEMNLYLLSGGTVSRIFAQGDGDEPMGAKATKGVIIGGTLYYAIKVNTESSLSYYVLATHSDCHYKLDENGTHVCIGCEQADETAHAEDVYVTKKKENGTAVYGVVNRVCQVCGEGEVVSVAATTVAEAIAAISTISIALDGYEWRYAITADEMLGIGEAAIFAFVEKGITYYALEVTLVRTDDETITKEYSYVEGGEPRTAGFILPVTNDGANRSKVAFEERMVGERTLNVISAKNIDTGEGEVYFGLSGTPTVGELKGVLLGYFVEHEGAEYSIAIRVSYDGLALSELVCGFFTEETMSYDIVEVKLINATTGETLSGNYYVAVKHICHKYLHNGSIHVCADCGEENAALHEEDVVETRKYVVGDEIYEFVIRKCTVCGSGTPIILSSETIDGLSAELALIYMTVYASDKNGNGGYHELPARLAEDKGDAYKLYCGSIKLKPDGAIVGVGGEEEGAVYDIIYVRFASDTHSHDGTYAMLFPHKCMEYKPNADGSGHICVECGEPYGEGDMPHGENFYGLQGMEYGGETVTVLNKYCAFCGQGHVHTAQATLVNAVNNTLKTETATIGEDEYSIEITDAKYKASPYMARPTQSNKSVTINEKTYYLWEITLTPKVAGSAESIVAYVLIGV